MTLRFKFWIEHLLEDNHFASSQDDQIKSLYDKVIDLLLGAAKKEINLSLSDIQDNDTGPGKPPISKGAQVVQKKLEKAGIFDKLQQISPELRQRAIDTQNHLGQIGNDQKVGPKDTVGGLLNMLFGPNAVNKYSKGLSVPSPTDHQPEDNQAQMPDATSPPAGGEQSDTSPQGGNSQMGGPPPGMPGQSPMGDPSQMMGGLPPGMPPMGGDPPPMGPPPGMPGQSPMGGLPPLQSPGGPMPKMPPGGMF